MRVLVSNQTGFLIGYLFGRAPEKLGHLYAPGGERGPWSFAPYALDNGAFGAFTAGKPFDFGAWRDLLHWSALSDQAPMWAAVPDVVGDWKATRSRWDEYSGEVRELCTPALVLQDGCSEADIPPEAEVLFVGGSVEWKWKNLPRWCELGRRVHVGRVCSPQKLRLCESLGVESIDGTGWFRGDANQTNGLLEWLGVDYRLEARKRIRSRKNTPAEKALPTIFRWEGN